MHNRNPYRQHIDFGALAFAYDPLRLHLKTSPSGGYTIDFKNPDAQRCLTEALLYRDFQLRIILPDNRLCPPVPNRLNYILWLQDIVQAHDTCIDRSDANICGIDIGTGASAIYPLLGCSSEVNWKFIATELDDTSLSFAKRNIELNGLTERIHLVKTSNDDSVLLPLKLYPTIIFDFTMCNPPFYKSVEEMSHSAIAKELPPNAICMGAEVEMVTPGGELTFVGQMVKDSVKYQDRCRWYTSMLGKLSSIVELVKILRENTISNYAITEFVQGQTRRWAIAWSFSDSHLPDNVARISNPTLQPYLPQRNTLNQIISISLSTFPHDTYTSIFKRSNSVLIDSLSQIAKISVQQRPQHNPLSPMYVTIYATQNTWSRSARRRALQCEYNQQPSQNTQSEPKEGRRHTIITSSMTATPPPPPPPPPPGSFICGIKLKTLLVEKGECTVENELVFQWIRGRDRAMFESFASHVTKKVRSCLSG